MVTEELLVRGCDVKIVIVEVKPDLIFVGSEPLCDKLDDELAHVSFSTCGSVIIPVWQVRPFGAEVDDEKVLVLQDWVADQNGLLHLCG